MNKASVALIAFFLSISSVIAGPPPDVSSGIPVAPAVKKTKNWSSLEYGWYRPSLKSLNDVFSGPLGGKGIGTNDYLVLGIGMPKSGSYQVGFFLGYWNGGAKQATNKLNINMITLSGEAAFRIVNIQDKVNFRLGYIMRDAVTWWNFSGEVDSSGSTLVMDIGVKATAQYYFTPNLAAKLDFGWIVWGFDTGPLTESEDVVKIETQGIIIKFGLELYY